MVKIEKQDSNRTNKPKTQEEKELFREDYGCLPKPVLVEKYGKSWRTIEDWALENGFKRTIKKPQIIVDKSVFHETSYEDLLNLLKQYSKASEDLFAAKTVKIKIDTDEPVAIVFSSDWHLGHPGVDYTKFDNDINSILNEKNVYMYLGGDSIENMISSKILCVQRQIDVSLQHEFMYKVLKKMESKILAFGTGNHTLWTEAQAKIDSMRELASKLNLVYTRDGGLLNLTVGKIEYNILRRHQFRMNSSANLTHCIKQMLRLENDDFDVGVIEHGHVPAMEEFYYKGHKRSALKCGSYKILWDEYAQGKGFTGVMALNPTIILFPDKFEILSFLDMYQAFGVLRNLLG